MPGPAVLWRAAAYRQAAGRIYAVPTWQQWFFGNISAHKKRHVRPIQSYMPFFAGVGAGHARPCRVWRAAAAQAGRGPHICGPYMAAMVFWEYLRPQKKACTTYPIVHAFFCGRRGRACPALPCMAGGCLQAGRGPHICGPYMAAMVFWEYLRPQKKACTTYPIVHANRTCLFMRSPLHGSNGFGNISAHKKRHVRGPGMPMPLPCMAGGCLHPGRPRAAYMRSLHGSNGFLGISPPTKKGMYDLSNRTCLFLRA